MQALIHHLRYAVCYIFSSASLGGTEEHWSVLNFSDNYESNGFIVIIKDLPIMTYDKSYSWTVRFCTFGMHWTGIFRNKQELV